MALSKARTDARVAMALHWSHRLGVLMAGRFTVLLGFALWALTGRSMATWWLWLSILLWGPVEAVGVRLVRTEVELVRAGGIGSSRMTMGTAIQLICIVVIFGLMSAKP